MNELDAEMTLRDYFAAKAFPAVYQEYVRRAEYRGWEESWQDRIAADAYNMADAMLKARCVHEHTGERR